MVKLAAPFSRTLRASKAVIGDPWRTGLGGRSAACPAWNGGVDEGKL